METQDPEWVNYVRRRIVKLFRRVFCLLLPMAALAQTDRGTITGTVSDPAGAVIPGAIVRVTNVDTASQSDTVTTSTGNYTLPQLMSPAPISAIRSHSLLSCPAETSACTVPSR
jgi:hypothetical protein